MDIQSQSDSVRSSTTKIVTRPLVRRNPAQQLSNHKLGNEHNQTYNPDIVESVRKYQRNQSQDSCIINSQVSTPQRNSRQQFQQPNTYQSDAQMVDNQYQSRNGPIPMQRTRDMSVEENRPRDQKHRNPNNGAHNSNFRNQQVQDMPDFQDLPVPDDGYLVLMVAEKPSIAKSIAEALSHGRYRFRKGICKFTPVLEFTGQIFGQKAHFRVTSVTGHIYCADFPPEYQDWKRVDPLSLFQANTVKRETNPDSDIVAHLQREAKQASFLVLWLDNDREGENICFEVLDNVRDHLRQEEFQQIYRAKFSSLVKEDLWQTFNSLKDEPNYNEHLSVEARQQLDLKIGVAFSRFQTGYFRRKYNDLNTKLVTYGPCQTPTLACCVERDDEIKNFVQRIFYRVVPGLDLPDNQVCDIHWAADRTYDEQEAHQIKAELEEEAQVVVVESTNKDGTRGRPEALNTVHMLKIASSNLGLGPNQTMQVAEKLYLEGFITYPRTESTSYAQNYDFVGVARSLTRLSVLSGYATGLLQMGLNKPKAGTDAGDHPPITPTQKVPMQERMQPNEWKLYEFVVRHFLASVSPDAKFSKKHVKFQAGQHEFTLNGTALASKGFTEILPWVKIYDKYIPNFAEGEVYQLSSVSVTTGRTTPPDHLTESDLISMMEQYNIGTDASMATHINNICVRNYVSVIGKNRKLVPSELGISLIHGFKSIDPELVALTLRGNIEQSVDMIAKGMADYDEVINNVLTIFSQKFVYFRNNITKMDAFFAGKFMTVNEARAQNPNGFNPQQNPSQYRGKNNIRILPYSIDNGNQFNGNANRDINSNYQGRRPLDVIQQNSTQQQQYSLNRSNNTMEQELSESIFQGTSQKRLGSRSTTDKKTLDRALPYQIQTPQQATGKYAPENDDGRQARQQAHGRAVATPNPRLNAHFENEHVNYPNENLLSQSKKIRKHESNSKSGFNSGQYKMGSNTKRAPVRPKTYGTPI